MEDSCSLQGDGSDEGVDQSTDTQCSDGLCQTPLPGSTEHSIYGQKEPWPDGGGLLTYEELRAKGYRLVDMNYLSHLHDTSIHQFNTTSSGDFAVGFWNGYGCAVKEIISSLRKIA